MSIKTLRNTHGHLQIDRLPADIWISILELLPTRSILLLTEIGNTMVSKHVYSSTRALIIHRGPFLHRNFPSNLFLNYTGLHDLCLTISPTIGSTTHIGHVSLLSGSLRSLTLEINPRSFLSFFELSSSTAQDSLISYLPHLTYLNVMDVNCRKKPQFWPTDEQTLKIGNILQNLPLETLILPSIAFGTTICQYLPLGLTHLLLLILQGSSDASQSISFPPHLTRLSLKSKFSFSSIRAAIPESLLQLDIATPVAPWEHLPPNLEYLSTSSDGPSTHELALLLPSSLKTLHIVGHMSPDLFGALPRTLTSFISDSKIWFKIPDVSLLPPSLTHFSAYHVPFEGREFQYLPRGLKSLQQAIYIDSSNVDYLPQLPPYFESFMIEIASLDAITTRKKVKLLEIFGADGIHTLPTSLANFSSLQELYISVCFDPSTLLLLGASLKKLTLKIENSAFTSFRLPDACLHTLEELIFLKTPGAEDLQNLSNATSWLNALPTSLEVLDLDHHTIPILALSKLPPSCAVVKVQTLTSEFELSDLCCLPSSIEHMKIFFVGPAQRKVLPLLPFLEEILASLPRRIQSFSLEYLPSMSRKIFSRGFRSSKSLRNALRDLFLRTLTSSTLPFLNVLSIAARNDIIIGADVRMAFQEAYEEVFGSDEQTTIEA